MCFTLASRGQEFHLHENQVIKDPFGLRPSSPASCRLEGTDRSNSFHNSRFYLPANRSTLEKGSIHSPHYAKGNSIRIRSLALCSFSAIVPGLHSKSSPMTAKATGCACAVFRGELFGGG